MKLTIFLLLFAAAVFAGLGRDDAGFRVTSHEVREPGSIAPFSTVLLTHADGSVTPSSPAADTDAARGDALYSAFSDLVAGETLDIGPGTYLIPRRLWKNAYYGDFTAQKVRGAGLGVTVVKLGDVGFPLAHLVS